MSNFIILDKNLIDLSIAATPANVLFELGKIIEENNLTGQKIKLILGDILLTPDHISNLKNILDKSKVELEVIYTKSLNTQLSALSAGFIVSEKIPSGETQNVVDSLEDIIIPTDTINQELSDQYETEKALEELMEHEAKEKASQEQEKTQDYRTKTLYLKQTMRSGQTVNFDGNIVIIGDCHPGSEIVASGDIAVWGILNGIAHAGAKGDYNASIRALKINAIQLRIADLFARKPDKLEVEKNEKVTSFIPEEAKISNGEIKIYSLNG